MQADYFVETYRSTDKAVSRENVTYFSEFGSAKDFADHAKSDLRWSAVRLHLPSRATDEERLTVREAGWDPN